MESYRNPSPARRCGETALASGDDEKGSLLGLRVSPGRSTQR